jgi:2-amino-4-hydroxy-6-hydroxymethyldihydropteridine diphosphokinase
MGYDVANDRAPEPRLTVIGLGSNLGDSRATLEAAMGAIAALAGVDLVARSTFWRSDPVGGPPQPDYCNAAVAVRTAMPLGRLMKELLAIEQRFGRVRGERNAPRTLDLDLLWVEGETIRSDDPGEPAVEVPHPRLHERAFALVPLLEVVPGATDPVTGKPYALLLAELGTEGVAPLDSPIA